MKKILFIIWSHSLGGGAETLLTTIVNHLCACKYEIGIIEIYHSTIKRESVNPNIKVYDAITCSDDEEYRKKMYYIYNQPNEMIKRYIPSNYDLYVSFNYQLPSFLLPDSTRNIAWIHGAVFDLAANGMEKYRFLQERAFEKSIKIISISDVTSKSIQELFPNHVNKIVEVYNSVNVKEIREKAQQHSVISLNQPAVIYVGRLDENKNPIRMVDIFNQVLQKENSAHLYFLGKGELESEVKKKVSEYGMQEKVDFLGYMKNPFPVIKQADVCCMTSKSEGFPMSLLESVALHVPFVSTEIGGAQILVNEGQCGKIYRTDQEAAESIVELLKVSKNVLKEECEKAISLFDLNTYISKIESIFDEILGLEEKRYKNAIWNTTRSMEGLKDRSYYLHFPEKLVERGKRVILYGAGEVGENYYQYIREMGKWNLIAWIDRAAEKYRSAGMDVKDIDVITKMEYDVILIAVMEERLSQTIRTSLCEKGITSHKILWAKPVY